MLELRGTHLGLLLEPGTPLLDELCHCSSELRAMSYERGEMYELIMP
jgi:hypothetical protein